MSLLACTWGDREYNLMRAAHLGADPEQILQTPPPGVRKGAPLPPALLATTFSPFPAKAEGVCPCPGTALAGAS